MIAITSQLPRAAHLSSADAFFEVLTFLLHKNFRPNFQLPAKTGTWHNRSVAADWGCASLHHKCQDALSCDMENCSYCRPYPNWFDPWTIWSWRCNVETSRRQVSTYKINNFNSCQGLCIPYLFESIDMNPLSHFPFVWSFEPSLLLGLLGPRSQLWWSVEASGTLYHHSLIHPHRNNISCFL